jgi:hypothetical protein
VHEPAHDRDEVACDGRVRDVMHTALRCRDACHVHHAERDAHELYDEGPHHPGREQERTQWRPDHLVRHQEARREPQVADAEVRPVDEHRLQDRRRGVGEHLGDAGQGHGGEYERDVEAPRRDETQSIATTPARNAPDAITRTRRSTRVAMAPASRPRIS